MMELLTGIAWVARILSESVDGMGAIVAVAMIAGLVAAGVELFE